MSNIESKFFVPKIEDLIFLSKKDFDKKASNFINPDEQYIAEQIISNFPDMDYFFHGGYSDAERKIIVIYPDILEDRPYVIPLSAIRITPKDKAYYPSHRDYLGAILALGISREKVGDLIINGNMCDAVIVSDIVEYVGLGLTEVGSSPVSTEEITLGEISKKESEYRKIKGTVASLRLDAVSSIAFGISRSKIAPYIKGENIRLNFRTINNPSTSVEEGDLISATRIGRARLAKVGGKSRKGRIHVEIHRYSSR